MGVRKFLSRVAAFSVAMRVLAPAGVFLGGPVAAQAEVTNSSVWHMGEAGSMSGANILDSVNTDGAYNNTNNGAHSYSVQTASPPLGGDTYLHFNGGWPSGAWIYTGGTAQTLPSDNYGFEIWARATATTGGYAPVMSLGSTTGTLQIAQNGYAGQNWGAIRDGQAWIPASGPGSGVTLNEWVDLAVVREFGVNKFYVNGVQVGTGDAGVPSNDGWVAFAMQHRTGTPTFVGDIDEARVFTFAPGGFSPLDLYVPVSPATVAAGSQFTYAGYVGKGLTTVPTHVPANVAQAAGAAPFAMNEYGAGVHTIAHLNDGTYGNSLSWLNAGGSPTTGVRSIDLGGSIGFIANQELAGIALSGPATVTGFSFGRDNRGAFGDRRVGTYYIQVTTTALNVADTSAASDAQWTTVGSLSGLDSFDLEYTLNSPLNLVTGLRIVTVGGNCIDEIAVYGTPYTPVNHTWSGLGDGVNWGDNSNWDSPPGNWDPITFGLAAGGATTNNLPASYVCGGITFADGAGQFTLNGSGNAITLAGDVVNNSTSLQTIGADLALGGTARTINAASGDITVNGIISGSASLTKTGSGKLTLGAVNTYTGTTTVSEGTLLVATGASIAGAASVNGGTLQVDALNGLSAAQPLTVNTGGTVVMNADQAIGTLATGTGGTIQLNGGSTLTVNQTGGDTGTVGPAVNITGNGNLVKAGNMHLRLFGELTYDGSTTVNGAYVLVLQGTNTTLPPKTLLTINDTAAVDLYGNGVSAKTDEISGLVGTGSVYSNAGPTNTLKINTLTGTDYFVHFGRIYGQALGDINLVKTGPGTQVLSGALTYAGSTTVSGGKLVLNGTLPSSAVVVNGSGEADNLSSLGGTGTLGQTVTVAGGADLSTQGAIDLTTDAAVGALTLNNANPATTILTLGGADPGNPSLLKFDMGSSLQADTITLTAGKLLVNPGGAIVDITVLPDTTVANGAYPLITFAAGQATRSGNFTLAEASQTLEGMRARLAGNSIGQYLLVGDAPLITAYWKGGAGTSWISVGNWAEDAAGTAATAVPTAISEVTFVGTGVTGAQSTTLDQDSSILALTFNGTASDAVAIAGPANKLTIGSGGINVAPGSGSHTISAGVELGTSQTWTVDNDDAKPLTVTGPISGLAGSESLTKAGSGKLVIAGTATYIGATAVNGGTLQVNGLLAYPGGLVTVATNGTLNVGATGSIARDVTVSGGKLTSAGTLGSVTVNGNGALTANGGSVSALVVGAGYSGTATINAPTTGPASVSVPAGTSGNVNLNHVNAMTTVSVGSGTVTLGNGVHVDNGASTALSLTGGTLKVADSPTAVATVSRADFSNYSAGNYTVNTQSGKLAVSGELKLAGNITATYAPAGIATSFAASGADLANNNAARTLTLSGGTLTLAGPPASAAAGAGNFSEYGTTVNGYEDSFEGTSLGAGWNLSDGLVAAVSGGKLTLTFGPNTTQPFSYTHNSLLYTSGSTNTPQTVLAKVKFNTVGTTDPTGRAGVTACTPVNNNGIRFLARNYAGGGGTNGLRFLNEAVAWGTASNTANWSSSKDYWMRLTYYPVASGGNAAGSMVGKLWLADGSTAEPTSAVNTSDRYYGTWSQGTIRNGYAGLTIGTADNMTVDYILIQNSGLPSISNVGVGLPSVIDLPSTNIAATATSELALVAGTATLGALSVSGTDTVLKFSGATAVNFAAAEVATGSKLNVNGIGTSLASLTGGGAITNDGTADSQITIGGGATEPFPEFSGAITDGATNKIGLVKGSAGTQILSGANTYKGGTTVTAGTLQIGSAGALPAGRSLTIGAGGTVVLSSGLSAASALSGASAAPVPEPGTMVLLAAGFATALAVWLRRRRP